MRYLNKICFINSAAVKYAELNLNGNVHFIGTQGVGKSTLLRAILYFYNANSLKLGVPSGPTNKSFAEWYFPCLNSFIVYEVKREHGAYCVLAFKAHSRICFYFIDAPFERDWLLDNDGKALDSWDKIRIILDEQRIIYSRRIKSYEEYRDILYGNTTGQSGLRRYALLESRQYMNIPRTIQNVFLNSKLDAEFIKQTIIDSMSEVDLQIDLNNYTHHLKNFETQLADIKQFRQPVVLRQASKATTLYVSINNLQQQLRQQAKCLCVALTEARESEPELHDMLGSSRIRQREAITILDREQERHQRSQKKIADEITVLNDTLKRAKKRQQEYDELNIQELIMRVSARDSLTRKQNDLLSEKDLLSSQFKDINRKYDALLVELENQQRTFCTLKEQEKLRLNEELLTSKEKLYHQYEKLLEEIRLQHKGNVELARQDCDVQQEQLYQIKHRISVVKHKQLYGDEITCQQQKLNALTLELEKAEQQQQANNTALEMFYRQQRIEEDALTQTYQLQAEKVTRQQQQLQQQIDEIAAKLASHHGSFYQWLTQNHSGWEDNIGKVCAEELLFDHSLNPCKSAVVSPGFYGVELDLSQRKKKSKDLADYQHQQNLLRQQFDSGQQQLVALEQELQENLHKVKQRLQPKVRQLKERNRELAYKIDQNPQQRQQVQLLLNQLQEKAHVEKQEKLEVLKTELAECNDKLLLAQQRLAQVEQQLRHQLNGKKREQTQKLTQIQRDCNTQLHHLDEQIEEYRQGCQQRKDEIAAQQQQELQHKGADTKRLQQIERALVEVQQELKFIENKRDVVAEYNKDKRELFDRLREFKNNKQLLESNLKQKRQEFEQQQQKRQQQLDILNEQIRHCEVELEQLKLDLQEFEKFKLSEVFSVVAPQLTSTDSCTDKQQLENSDGCRDIISTIKDLFYAKLRRQTDLKEIVDKFLGHFSADNVFKFKTQLASLDSYLNFSHELTEFIEEDKIGEFERRVNERFADIISGIGKETTDLMARKGDIQKVIQKINRDFSEKNFVGAIRNIELKLDDSANSVFVVLQQIKEFNDNHSLDLGPQDLFSSPDRDSNNQQAVSLLKLLLKEINQNKNTVITLSDSFELKFRIEENQNDTGWVEKLSNVGSDGTDILVKAMVNIMLLNVFKEGASRKFKDFRLHCMMDEIGKLHPNNVRGILRFANDRNILLINGSPTENNALNYKHIYKIAKDSQQVTCVTRILTNNSAS